MENVILIVHLVLALCLIGVVLLQRSEGGGLGLGGGGGVMTGRGAATALGQITWALAIAFLCTSLALTVFAARDASGTSVLDRITDAPAVEIPTTPDTDLLPPTPGGSLTDDLLPELDSSDLLAPPATE